jgi:HAD superfamily hydrolase (TIGR01548 family)
VTPKSDILIFDMDGVLVEVTESYRETICQTVAHFSGKTISRQLVQDYKNQGGWNNDWLLSEKILIDLGHPVAFETVKEQFNKIFFGNVVDGIADGLMSREEWLASPGLLERLARRYHLAIFTGREHEEALMSLRRFAPQIGFNPVLAADHGVVAKPAPDGLLHIAKLFPGRELWYVGDTVDDARSARAAGVPFIGVAAPLVPERETLLALFQEEGALHVVEDINQLPEILLI